MNITQLTLNKFRCFDEKTFVFDNNVIVIEGCNGSGKSSILEALHYACYFRSFRTHSANDLVFLGTKHFFIEVKFSEEKESPEESIQIGFAGGNKKTVKLDSKALQSYKELITHYKIVTLTADDVALVQGEPELRRDFLNAALVLQNPNFISTLKTYKRILAQRNALLINGNLNNEEFVIWTKQLFELTTSIQQERIAYLLNLEASVNNLIQNFIPDEEFFISFKYQTKVIQPDELYDNFIKRYNNIHGEQERLWKRTLFGAHLDDFVITFQGKKARGYASRGQQKLLTLVIKVAQLKEALARLNIKPVFLVDDFLTDFDAKRTQQCLKMLVALNIQLFLTVPLPLSQDFIKVLGDNITFIKLS